MAGSESSQASGLPEQLEESVAKIRASRTGKMSHLTRRMNIINTLMTDKECYDEVKGNMLKFNQMFHEFKSLQTSYVEMLDEKDQIEDVRSWYEPKLEQINVFLNDVTKWMSKMECPEISDAGKPEECLDDDEEDSVSVAGSVHSDKSGKSRASVTSTSYARINAEAERAALLAKAAGLQRKHTLEEEQEKLDKKREEIRKRRETLEIETEIAATTAKIDYFKGIEMSAKGSTMDKDSESVSAYLDEVENMEFYSIGEQAPVTRPKEGVAVQFPNASRPQHMSAQGSRTVKTEELQTALHQPDQFTRVLAGASRDQRGGMHTSTSTTQDSRNDSVTEILRRQIDLTNILVKQQSLTTLPKSNLQVFEGDILQYKNFIHSFEHMVENKTDNHQDRLLFLLQFTKGKAQEFIKSCQHMSLEDGYKKAKDILKEQFGNEYKISCAYMERILNWPTIKSEDHKALQEFALFLRGCCNAVKELKYLEELNTVSNMRNVSLKLPYKLREKWRAKAFELQGRQKRRVAMDDLVHFIETQVSIISDPIFGDIQDSNVKTKYKAAVKPKSKGTFATSVNIKSSQPPTLKIPDLSCLFCSGEHELAVCPQFEKQVHKEKITFLRKNGVCFGCLKQDRHMSKDCTRRLTCKLCSKQHPSLLHIHFKEIESAESFPKTPVSSAHVYVDGRAGAANVQRECMLSLVPVQVKSSKGSTVIHTYAFLDPGSSATFCTEKLMHKLNIPGRKSNIMLRTMSQQKSVPTYVVTGLKVSALDENNFITLPEVYTQKNMPVDTNSIPTKDELLRWPYLNKVRIPIIESEVDLLIGNNAPKAIEPWEIVNSQDDGPYAVKTRLGWVVNGPLGEGNITDKSGFPYVTSNRIAIEELLMQQYNHDFNEHSTEDNLEMSVEDKKFLKMAEESIQLQDGHYSLNLPFRKKDPVMPNNYSAAVQRLSSLQRRFKKNEPFKTEYIDFLTEVINKGHAEVVSQEELERSDGKVWYIPHHGVYHPKKGTIRVVFDCAATFQGTSLNSELLPGPDLTNTLFGVLTRFRQEPVAVMTDIKSMFHQVRVSKPHVDFLRFLWWPHGDVSKNPIEHRMVVHLFGAVSSPSCANFALRQTAKDNRNYFSPKVVNTIEKSFYVDDCLKAVSTEQEAVELVKDLTALCHKGGFHLTKWVSNSRKVLSSIPKEERAQEVKELNLDKDKLPIERTLGLLWCVENDEFKFNIIIRQKPHTRRNMLSVISSIYDPLGFLCPFTLPVKLLLQELCRGKHGWDEEVPALTANKWTRWIADLGKLDDFKVARCIKPAGFGVLAQAELHHFSDASDNGYGTVSYLRLTTDKNSVHVSFMLGKARVSPLKQITIPRMELVAAVLAVKVDKMLRKELELNLDISTFWTDSQSVLKYIANEHTRFRTFVANRVTTIRENTDVSQWRYIKTNQNPADIASRGVSANVLAKHKEWINGPEFLWRTKEEWPQDCMESSSLSTDDLELKRTSMVCNAVIKDEENPTSKLLAYFSSWEKLQRAVVWFLKWKNILHSISSKRKNINSDLGIKTRSQNKALSEELKRFKGTFGVQSVTMEDLLQAERAIVEFCQRQRFAEEIARLKTSPSGKGVSKTSSLYKLDPILEDGILRVGGRLSRSAMPEEAKRPVILPKDAHISSLILRHIHEQIGHGGRNHVLSQLRKKYWIVNANSAARSILSKCVVCRRVRGKTGLQKMADLPQERLRADLPPFSNVGVDYFGPFKTRRARGHIKRYGVIFTCMSSRAVHLEVANSLDTDSCINALRRFICRRGQVKHIRSDNGTNLIGAKNELQESLVTWNQSKIQKAMLQKEVLWSFNPPAASHHGGVWERLIRMVRQILYSILKQQSLDDEGLQTLFCEVEAILNGRPITSSSDDSNDLEALTPNHILLLKSDVNLPPGLFEVSDLYIRRRWRQVQYMADIFWKRWTREYVSLLQERQKWMVVKRSYKIGDIVMVVDKTAPRGSWPLGRIIEVQPDNKGLVRQVKLKTKTCILERPVTKLCLLLEMEEDITSK